MVSVPNVPAIFCATFRVVPVTEKNNTEIFFPFSTVVLPSVSLFSVVEFSVVTSVLSEISSVGFFVSPQVAKEIISTTAIIIVTNFFI